MNITKLVEFLSSQLVFSLCFLFSDLTVVEHENIMQWLDFCCRVCDHDTSRTSVERPELVKILSKFCF